MGCVHGVIFQDGTDGRGFVQPCHHEDDAARMVDQRCCEGDAMRHASWRLRYYNGTDLLTESGRPWKQRCGMAVIAKTQENEIKPRPCRKRNSELLTNRLFVTTSRQIGQSRFAFDAKNLRG